MTGTLPAFSFDFRALAADGAVRVCAVEEADARGWAEAAIAEVRRIEARYARDRAGVTARINAAAGGAIEVDDETAALLDFGERLFRRSDGAFDLTRPAGGRTRIDWKRPTLRLTAGVAIDLNDLLVAYATDRAAAALQTHGARRGTIALGGAVRGIGAQPDGAPWRVGRFEIVKDALFTAAECIDARTGRPSAHWRRITVAAPSCVAAAACATVAAFRPPAEALALLRAQRVAFDAVADDGTAYRD